MLYVRALGSLLVLSTLAVVGCQGQGDDLDQETTSQDLAVADVAATADAPADVAKHPDPARFFARLDKDGDGRVLVSELEGRHKEHLVKADLDGDGVLTKVELTTAHSQFEARMKEEMFSRADKNGDGTLAESEVEARHWAHLKVADTNGDSLITKAELEAAHANGTLRPPPGAHGGHHGPPTVAGMLEHFDSDKDGKLALTELPEPMRERIQADDTNGDGVLDGAELQVHLTQMKARFEAEHPDFAAKAAARRDRAD